MQTISFVKLKKKKKKKSSAENKKKIKKSSAENKKKNKKNHRLKILPSILISQGPVVQSIVSLTSSLRAISLTVLADLKNNILIFFAEKM